MRQSSIRVLNLVVTFLTAPTALLNKGSQIKYPFHNFALNCFAFLYFVLLKTAPPYIEENLSTVSVICEKETVCFLSCHAISDYPVTYSWTKNGDTLDSNDFKMMNNTVAVKPREEKDYGVYVCNASNSYGYTSYKITLSECPKCSTTVLCSKYSSQLFLSTHKSLVILGHE